MAPKSLWITIFFLLLSVLFLPHCTVFQLLPPMDCKNDTDCGRFRRCVSGACTLPDIEAINPIERSLESQAENTEETTPEEATSEEITSEAEPAPNELPPEEAMMPEEMMPEEMMPEEMMPEEAMPEEMIPEEAMPEEMMPEEAMPEEALPEENSQATENTLEEPSPDAGNP